MSAVSIETANSLLAGSMLSAPSEFCLGRDGVAAREGADETDADDASAFGMRRRRPRMIAPWGSSEGRKRWGESQSQNVTR